MGFSCRRKYEFRRRPPFSYPQAAGQAALVFVEDEDDEPLDEPLDDDELPDDELPEDEEPPDEEELDSDDDEDEDDEEAVEDSDLAGTVLLPDERLSLR
jgi:hypothetical protein